MCVVVVVEAREGGRLCAFGSESTPTMRAKLRLKLTQALSPSRAKSSLPLLLSFFFFSLPSAAQALQLEELSPWDPG